MIIQPFFDGCLRHQIAIPIDTTAIHRYAPTCGASQKKHSPLVCANGAVHRKNRRSAVVEMPSPHRHRRGATALFRNLVRGAKRMRAGILRILQISRAGGTPLPMAGRLTQLAKIFPVIYTTALRR